MADSYLKKKEFKFESNEKNTFFAEKKHNVTFKMELSCKL